MNFRLYCPTTMRLWKSILFKGAFFFILNTVFAQEPINFSTINSNQGLSSNSVSTILKDRYGMMWFGTNDGLNKFDGTRFTTYRTRAGDSTSLQANEILAIHEDKAGNLWVGTGGGSLSLYDRKSDAFSNFPATSALHTINNNVILSLCSDFNGKLWIGSYGGVNILDPKTFKISRFLITGGAAFIKSAMCLFQDSKRVMWIGTSNGLYAFDPDSKKLTSYLHKSDDRNSLTGNIVKTIVEDDKGRLWVGTTSGISMKTPGKNRFTNYQHQPNTPNSISKGDINSMAPDDSGRLWIGTGSGLDIFNTQTGQITNIAYDKRNVQGLAGRNVTTIYNDHQGISWIGTFQGGISKYDKNLNLFNLVQSNPFDAEGLPSPLVTSFSQSDDDKVFIGTEHGGVSLFDQKRKTFKRFKIKSQANSNEEGLVVLALKYTRKNELLIGTYGDGLIILNPETGKYEQMTVKNGLSSNEIYSIAQDLNQNIWLGCNGTGMVVLNPQHKVIARYTPDPTVAGDSKLPINGYIRDILEDRSGNLWIATHGGGIAMLDIASKHFSIYNTQNSNLPTDKVQALCEDSHGNIWAGTYGGGLVLFNKEKQQFTTFSEKDGLANNNVYMILEDSKGKLWASTNQGISCFDMTTKKFSNFNFHNGLQPSNFSRGAGLLAKDGQLYFGGLQGFNYFHPSSLNTNNNIPSVLFTELRISNVSVAPSKDGPIRENIAVTKEINLDYKQNFALSFVGLNFTAPEQNQYAYKLEGFDRDWNYIGNANTASYTNLDPGEYVFRVRASNNDGLWNNEGSSVKITVHPPFWRTGYAYLFYALAAIGILLFSRYKSIQRVKQEFERRQEKMKLEQERRETERIIELDQQKIKFLTNLSHEFRTPISLILGPIDTLIQQKNNEQSFGQLQMVKRNAKRLLNLVNQLLDFRKMEEQELTLQLKKGELVTFVREATESFRDLAERKKIGLVFNHHINHLETKFDHDKMERILFNLLSNAFKFTVEGGRVMVEVDKLKGSTDDPRTWIALKVSDTGIGIPREKQEKVFETFFQVSTASAILNQGTGIGLSITKEFVRMQGGNIRVESEVDKGSCFTIELPFEEVNQPEMEVVPALNKSSIYAESAAILNTDVFKPAERTSVLLVEDNDDFRLYLKDKLSTHYKVLEAVNGKDGWQKALAEHPQLIVSDISMPYMDGIELCQKIKADKRTNHIPVILLTALTGEQDQLKGLEIGANDYITKPFNFEMLNAKVRNLLILNNCLKNTYTKQFKIHTPEVAIESEDEKLISGIMEYLEEHLTNTQLSVEGLSRQVGMSRSSLYSKLLELTGETPVEFIRSVKLDKAAVLLEKSDMNIAQVAYSVGFATPNYFAKSFKSKFNMLPSEYILKMRNGK